MWSSQASFRSFNNTTDTLLGTNSFVKKEIDKNPTYCIRAAAASQDEQRLIIYHDLQTSKINTFPALVLDSKKSQQGKDLFRPTCDWPPRGWGEGPAMGGLDQDHCSRSRTQTSLLLKHEETKTVT